MRVNTRASTAEQRVHAPSASSGSFGLSPRISSAVRPVQTNGNTVPLSSYAHPRTQPSPKLPHAGAYQPSPYTAFADSVSPPQPWETSAKRRSANTQFAQQTQPYSNGYSLTQYAPQNSSAFVPYQKERSSPTPSGNGSQGATGAYYPMNPGPLRRDDESEDLKLWKQQQKILDIQARNLNMMKYGFMLTLGTMLLIIVYLLTQQHAPTMRAVLETDLHAQDKLNTIAPTVPDGIGGAGPDVLPGITTYTTLGNRADRPPQPTHAEMELSAEELEASRREVAEWTRKQSEQERIDLYELDSSSRSVQLDPSDPRSALNPVRRAIEAIPQPDLQVGAGDAHEYASQHAPLHPPSETNWDETPEMLRRLGEAAAAGAGNGDEEEELSPTPAARKEHTGVSPTSLLDAEVAARIPSRPHPSPSSHLVIEQLLHEHTPEGHTPRIHAHKDHPSVPKTGKGAPHIAMPPPDNAPRKKMDEKPKVPSAQDAQETAVEAEVAAMKLAEAEARAAAKADRATETIEIDVTPSTSKPSPTAKEPLATSAPAPTPSAPTASTDEPVKHGRKKEPKVDSTSPVTHTPASGETTAAPSSDDEEDILSQLSEASKPQSVSDHADSAAVQANKGTGLKGTVLRGANSDAAQVAESVDLQVGAKSTAATEKPDTPKDNGKAAEKDGTTTSDASAAPAPSSIDRKAAATAWSRFRGQSLGEQIKFPVDTSAVDPSGSDVSTHHYLFGDDVQFIVMTSLKNQALARKVKTLYSPLIKRLHFVSDHRDAGLNATVLVNPHQDWTVKSSKEAPWKLYELFKLLLDPKRAPHGEPSKFYFVMHDITFPLLDQIKWRLEEYLKAYNGNYPNFVGGRKTAQSFEASYWKEQQDAGVKVFQGKKLFVVPCQLAYMYGFDHHFLSAISDFTNTDSCPLLTTEGLALAGLVECAGGTLEQTEYDFLVQTRSNHREKKLKDTNSLKEWRTFDAFNGCNTPGMLQEAYDWYYGRLKSATTPAATAED